MESEKNVLFFCFTKRERDWIYTEDKVISFFKGLIIQKMRSVHFTGKTIDKAGQKKNKVIT
jgi:hypothetical protein